MKITECLFFCVVFLGLFSHCAFCMKSSSENDVSSKAKYIFSCAKGIYESSELYREKAKKIYELAYPFIEFVEPRLKHTGKISAGIKGLKGCLGWLGVTNSGQEQLKSVEAEIKYKEEQISYQKEQMSAIQSKNDYLQKLDEELKALNLLFLEEQERTSNFSSRSEKETQKSQDCCSTHSPVPELMNENEKFEIRIGDNDPVVCSGGYFSELVKKENECSQRAIGVREIEARNKAVQLLQNEFRRVLSKRIVDKKQTMKKACGKMQILDNHFF